MIIIAFIIINVLFSHMHRGLEGFCGDLRIQYIAIIVKFELSVKGLWGKLIIWNAWGEGGGGNFLQVFKRSGRGRGKGYLGGGYATMKSKAAGCATSRFTSAAASAAPPSSAAAAALRLGRPLPPIRRRSWSVAGH